MVRSRKILLIYRAAIVGKNAANALKPSARLPAYRESRDAQLIAPSSRETAVFQYLRNLFATDLRLARYRFTSEGAANMKIFRRALPVIGVLFIAACNTVEGAGQDMTRAGVAIQQEARAAQQ